MKIIYKNKSAEKAFSSAYISKANYPKPVTKKLVSIENFIEQAESLLDIVKYPPFHFHSLQGKLKGEWAINVGSTGYRVQAIPCDEEGNEITTGDIIAQCKTIMIIEITGVSNHYE